jgi:Ser/Thr protein kinase RdoA (MazF antagonist)
MGQQSVKEALSFYDFRNPEAILIRHNENETYKLTDGFSGDQYVMRIHRPIEGFSLGLFGEGGHTPNYLKGEINILTELKSHTSIPVQTPIKNQSDSFVTLLSDQTPVTVFRWVEGDTLEEHELTDELAYKVGEMTARMHQQFRQMASSHKIVRYSYDRALLPRIAERIQNAHAQNFLTEEHSGQILSALKAIDRRMAELDLLPNHKGIVHSDLSKSNLILHDNQITPIDFCLSGYSYYYMDLGSLFSHFTKRSEQNSILEGYQSVIGEEIALKYIEPFNVLQILLFISCQYEKAGREDWFRGAVDRWCNDYFIPLHMNTPFLF